MSFEKLDVKELRRTADEDFAVEVGATDGKKVVIAALLESGVTFDQYLEMNPHQQEKFAPVEAAASGVVTATQMQEPVVEEQVEIVVKEEVPLTTKQEWLIRMVRENPLYEVRGHRFTQENPFALVDPADAEYLLTRETGFRQATPSELSSFFG